MNKIIVSDDHLVMKDGVWEKRPGRIKVAFHTISISQSDRQAEQIIRNPRLNDSKRTRLLGILSNFLNAYMQLNRHIRTPKGNIDVAEHSPELNNLWHLYLVRGRELVDEIGKTIHICFDLKQWIMPLAPQMLLWKL